MEDCVALANRLTEKTESLHRYFIEIINKEPEGWWKEGENQGRNWKLRKFT